MVLSLPSALANFSAAAQKNIEALDGITKSIPNAQTSVQSNINNAVTEKIVTEPGNIFAPVSDFVKSGADQFLNGFAGAKSLSPTLQTSSLSNLFGTGFTKGGAVDQFLATDVKLADILPAQQIYALAQNLGSTSFYADPLQAYAHVTSASNDISNLCREAEDIIADITQQITDLLSVQATMNYQQITAANQEFFGDAGVKANNTITLLNIVNDTLNARGRHDAAQISDLCAAIDDLTNFVMFANSKFLQFEILRKSILEGLERLAQIAEQIIEIINNVKGYLDEYIASALFGKIFNAVQKAVVAQSGIDLQRILNDLVAFSEVSADDRSKLLMIFGSVASLNAIKSYICKLDPSVDVGSAPEFTNLKSGYDGFVADLIANDLEPAFATVEALIPTFGPSLNSGLIRDNKTELASESAAMTAALGTLAILLNNVCGASDLFRALFVTETQIDPERVVGPLDLFENVGADNARDVAKGAKPGDITDLPVSESTKPGQLAESVKTTIESLPEGNEKDQLTLLHSQILSRHRATVLGMDFQRRKDVKTFLAADEAETNRQLVNDTVKTFSGLDPTEFDSIFTL
jgi:hypothetical protein